MKGLKRLNNGSFYEYNDKCFDELNEQSVYWLGFLYADGCLHEIKNNKKIVRLGIIDGEHLEKFKRFLGTNAPVYRYSKGLNRNKTRELEVFIVSICNQKITNKLFELGLIPRKSLVLEFPKFIRADLYAHFIRGYFDGDGGICIKYRARSVFPRLTFTGTFNFLTMIINIFTSELKIKCPKLNKNSKSNIYNLCFNNRDKIIKIRDYLYADSSVWLDRKYEKLFKVNFYEKLGGTSKFKNVCFRPKKNRWRATYYNSNGKRTDRNFKTEQEAVDFLRNYQ